MRYVKLPRPVHFCNCGDHAWTALTKGYATIVSPEDVYFLQERAWAALVNPKKKTVYAVSGSGTHIRLHRVILSVPEENHVDHHNGNGLDNRRKNIRPATNQQNCQNGTAHRDSTSKFKGVCWDRQNENWRVTIFVDKKQINLGRFGDEERAACAYDTAAIKHFGPYARLNFPA